MTKYMSLVDARDWVLAALYYRLIEEDNESTSIDHIMEHAPDELSKALCRRATKELWEKMLVSSETKPSDTGWGISTEVQRHVREFNPNNFTISNRGIESAESLLHERTELSEVFSQLYSSNGISTSLESDEILIGHNGGPILDLEEHKQVVADGIIALESAVDAIRSDNIVDENVREATISAITIGLTGLKKGGKILLESVRIPILSGLRRALESSTAEFTKSKITSALDWLVEFFVGTTNA